MIAYKEKAAVPGELFKPGDDRLDPAVKTQQRCRGIACETAERILLLEGLVHRDRVRDHAEEENIEDMKQEKAQQRDQKRKPNAQVKHRERKRKDAKQGNGSKGQKQRHNKSPVSQSKVRFQIRPSGRGRSAQRYGCTALRRPAIRSAADSGSSSGMTQQP